MGRDDLGRSLARRRVSGLKAAEVEEGSPEINGAGRREREVPSRLEETDAHGPPRAGKNLSEAVSGAGFRLNPLCADQGRLKRCGLGKNYLPQKPGHPNFHFQGR